MTARSRTPRCAPLLCLALVVGVAACGPRRRVEVMPKRLCDCAPVQVTWDTNGTDPRLEVDPEATPPTSGPVPLTGNKMMTVCQDTRVTLRVRDEEGRREYQVQDSVSKVSVGEQPLVLSFEPLCSGSTFLGWRALGNIEGELVAGMRVREVINTGPQDILNLRHEGVVESNMSPGTRTGRFRDTRPEGIWDATTLNRGSCPGSTRPEPGDPTPPQVTVLVGCRE